MRRPGRHERGPRGPNPGWHSVAEVNETLLPRSYVLGPQRRGLEPSESAAPTAPPPGAHSNDLTPPPTLRIPVRLPGRRGKRGNAAPGTVTSETHGSDLPYPAGKGGGERRTGWQVGTNQASVTLQLVVADDRNPVAGRDIIQEPPRPPEEGENAPRPLDWA